MAQILPKTDYYPDKVKVYGPGVESTGVQKGKPTKFYVDNTKAGTAPLDIKV